MSQCSSCGNENVEVVQMIECRHIQRWEEKKDKDTKMFVREFREVLAKNNWTIALCRQCLVKRHKQNLVTNIYFAPVIPLFFIVVGKLMSYIFTHHSSLKNIPFLFDLLMYFGILLIPLSIIFVLINLIKIYRLFKVKEVSTKHHRMAILREGSRIRHSIELAQNDYFGTYSMPQGKPREIDFPYTTYFEVAPLEQEKKETNEAVG